MTQNGPMRACAGVLGASGGKGLCYGGKSAGLVGRKLGAAGGHLGHPPVETNCLRVKPRHGERSSHDWVVGVPGCSWVRNPVHPTLIP